MDISEETHVGKSYCDHAKECYELVNKLMGDVYSFPEDLVKLALLFSELHDVGKLLPSWSLSQKRRPYHAIEGAEWLLREGLDLLTNPYGKLLVYAVMTHHSPLRVPGEVERAIEKAEKIAQRNYYKCRTLLNALNEIIKEVERSTRFDIVDAIGIAKLADIISAKSLPQLSTLSANIAGQRV